MVKSHASFRSRNGCQRQRTSIYSKEIGLAKKLGRPSPSRSTKEKRSSNSDRQRVCRCNLYIRTTLPCKDTLSGLHGTKMERSLGCTSEHHECATCRSSV